MTIIAQYESVDIILEVRFSRDYGLFLNFNLFSLSKPRKECNNRNN